jgi:hypothetical protein
VVRARSGKERSDGHGLQCRKACEASVTCCRGAWRASPNCSQWMILESSTLAPQAP